MNFPDSNFNKWAHAKKFFSSFNSQHLEESAPAGLLLSHTFYSKSDSGHSSGKKGRNAAYLSPFLKTVFNETPIGLASLRAVRNVSNRLIDFEWVLINRSGEEALRKSAEQVVGQRVFLNLPRKTVFKQLFQNFRQIVETGKEEQFEYFEQLTHPPRWYKFAAKKLGDGLLVTFHDISANKKDKVDLHASGARLSTIIESMQDPVFAIDNHYRYTAFNHAHADWMHIMYGVEIEVGQSMPGYLPEQEYYQMFKEYLDRGLNGVQFREEIHYGAVNKIWYETAFNPIRNECGKVVGLAIIARDISDRKRNHHKVLKEKRRAESSSKAKSEFLAKMSHEFRTPMNGIIGFSELLLHTSLDKEQREYLETIKYSASSLLGLINDILDFSKIEAGKLEIVPAVFHLQKQLQNIFKTLQLKADQKMVRMHLNIDPRVPDTLLGDADRMRQILVNLIDNAIKFTPKGSIQLKVWCEPLVGQQILMHFRIQDTGIGIPKAKLRRIFYAFSQAERSTTREFGGTGLGLAISRQLCRLMGGDIQVESEIGQGSTFTFTLLFQEVSQNESFLEYESQKYDSEPYDTSMEQSGAQFDILLAEDNPVNQKLVVYMLQKMGHRVTVVQNGHEAVKMAFQKYFDLIFMDIEMPGLNGLQATELIRQKETSRHIPIVAMTANAMKGDEEKCLQAGMDDYISKPVSMKQIRDKLIRLINPHLNYSSFMHTDKEFFDYERALERFGNDKTFFNELLGLFVQDITKQWQAFEDAYFTQKDYNLARIHIHSVSGSSANLSFNRLHKQARLIEKALSEVKPNWQHLEEEIDKIKEMIDSVREHAIRFLDKTKKVKE